MGEKQREIIAMVLPTYRKTGGYGPDRNLHHAVLPPHSAVDLRFQYRRRGASQRGAAPLSLSGGRAPATGTGARIRETAVRRRARWACGLPKDRFPTRSSPSQPNWASSGPPPDNGVLDRTLSAPCRWKGSTGQRRRQGGRSMGVIFRDHFLSDLIGFVYSQYGRRARAAEDFLRRIRENCAGILAQARRPGAHHPRRRKRVGVLRRQRPPLPARALLRISEDGGMRAVTVSEAFG